MYRETLETQDWDYRPGQPLPPSQNSLLKDPMQYNTASLRPYLLAYISYPPVAEAASYRLYKTLQGCCVLLVPKSGQKLLWT